MHIEQFLLETSPDLLDDPLEVSEKANIVTLLFQKIGVTHM